MRIIKEEFLKAHADLEIEIESLKRNKDGVCKDGALNPKVYFNTRPKILWILKESYGQPISYINLLNNKYEEMFEKFLCGTSKHTWAPLSIISNQILNGCEFYNSESEMVHLKNSIETSLKSIALINIIKDPSETGGTSLDSNIKKAQQHYERILIKQIELLDSDIIICGNTFKFIKHLYNYPEVIKEAGGTKYVDHYVIGNKLILEAFHPGYTRFNQIDTQMYINDIIRTVKDRFVIN